MVIPHQKRKEMDKLKSEQWPDVTLFKNWKTSFPREVITGSSRPRQATDWLAEIDQATPVHDLDDVGSVFGSTRMSFEHQYSKFAKGPHEGHEFNRKFLEAVEFCKSTKSPEVDRETDRLHSLRLVQDQRRSEESCEHERLAQYRVVNDTLKKFEAWEESLMALKELDAALWKALYHRQWERSTLRHSAWALYDSDAIHRKERTTRG